LTLMLIQNFMLVAVLGSKAKISDTWKIRRNFSSVYKIGRAA